MSNPRNAVSDIEAIAMRLKNARRHFEEAERDLLRTDMTWEDRVSAKMTKADAQQRLLTLETEIIEAAEQAAREFL